LIEQVVNLLVHVRVHLRQHLMLRSKPATNSFANSARWPNLRTCVAIHGILSQRLRRRAQINSIDPQQPIKQRL
jgi:hypothetical protein